MKRLLTVAVVAGSMFAVAALASAAEPTQADFDACNRVAQAGGSSPSASPQVGGATGPSITTPGGTPDSTGGVQPGGARGKTGPMITGSGREPGSTGGVGGGTGAVAKDSTDGGGPRRGPRLTKPYVTSGYVLVVPPTSPPIERLEDVKGKIAVEHTSWPHYVLERRNLPLSSHGSPFDVLDAVAQGQSAAGLVSDAYTGWYLKLHPGAVKISETYVPERDFRWNVAVGLRNADTPLVDAVNHALDALIADQTIPKIFARYGISYRPPAAP